MAHLSGDLRRLVVAFAVVVAAMIALGLLLH
jgi:hypothetical protein